MRIFSLFRRFHKWVSLVAALPLILIFATGIALSISPKVEFLQPQSPPTSAPGISISFDQILSAAQTVGEAGIKSWSDVAQIDARPKAGVIRVRASNYWEVQIDGNTGAVLGAAPRWKTLLITLHEGSWFSNWIRYWVFLPAGICALILWVTGIGLWLIPVMKKRGRS